MKNKKVNLENIAGGFNIRRAFGRAASSARNGLTRFIESEAGQRLGSKAKGLLAKIGKKLEAKADKYLDSKANKFIDNHLS